jgi:hypothetical protein
VTGDRTAAQDDRQPRPEIPPRILDRRIEECARSRPRGLCEDAPIKQAGCDRLTFDEALALVNGWNGTSEGSSERRRSPRRDHGHRPPRSVAAWYPTPGRDEEGQVDIAELSGCLVLVACAKNEDPDVTVNQVVTMPGHAE